MRGALVDHPGAVVRPSMQNAQSLCSLEALSVKAQPNVQLLLWCASLISIVHAAVDASPHLGNVGLIMEGGGYPHVCVPRSMKVWDGKMGRRGKEKLVNVGAKQA